MDTVLVDFTPNFKKETIDNKSSEEDISMEWKPFKKSLKPKRWMIPKMLTYQGIMQVYGEQGTMKSSLAVHIAVACAKGGKVFGEYKVKQIPVLILSADSGDGVLAEQMAAVLKAQKYRGKNIHIVKRKDTLPLNNSNFKDKLIKTIKKNKIKLIICDTMDYLYGDTDSYRSDQMNQFYHDHIYPMLDEYDLSIISLAHKGKSEGAKGSIGSMKIGACSDFDVEVVRDGNFFNYIQHKCRRGKEHVFTCQCIITNILKKDEMDSMDFKFVNMVLKEEFMNKRLGIKKAILSELAKHPLSSSELSAKLEGMGYKKTLIKEVMVDMDDKIVKEGGQKGKWALRTQGVL